MKKIAVVGAGLFGLALCYFLKKHSLVELSCFEREDQQSASSVALGLLHPFVGKAAKLNYQGREAYNLTLSLFEELGGSFYQKTGLLRIARTDEQRLWFEESAKLNPEITLWPREACEEVITGKAPFGGAWIASALSVDTKSYLKSLRSHLEEMECQFVRKTVSDLKALDDFDQVLIAAGDACPSLVPSLKLQQIKGQQIRFEWNNTISPPPFPIMLRTTLSVSESMQAWAGATYERNFSDPFPNKSTALEQILPDIQALYPDFTLPDNVEVKAGVRIFTPTRRPELIKIDENLSVATGLGSKGLLYHALYSREFSK